ncbi:type II secretion system F family protein [uncultured Aeromicrobium sp.]|uniref:type II secretion system F family protein n=1 Tax=uncultured Aeromicrobium sp. TaxID=337820 RepID=UPI0025D83770|nr:type II secretion system F family protein [uncultured Aeromicrobium sp.]
MTLIALVCAAAAGYAAVPGSAAGRWRALRRATWSPRKLRLPLVAGLLAPLLGFALAGAWGAFLGVVGAPLIARTVDRLEPASRRRERRLAAEQLPLAVDLTAAAVAGGVPVHRAISLVADAMPEPIGSQLAGVSRSLTVSGDVVEVGEENPLAPLVRALQRATTSGVPIVAVLEDTARELHRDRRASRRDAARRVGVRTAAPLGACFLPAFFLVGIVPALFGAFAGISW